MTGRIVSRLALSALTFTLGASVLVGGAAAQPQSFDQMVGTCPAPSIDPTSICYDEAKARAYHSGDAWTILSLEAGHDCTPNGTPGRIPVSVVLAAGGRIQRLPFAEAWTLVHGAGPTRVYAQCFS